MYISERASEGLVSIVRTKGEGGTDIIPVNG
jgi:hypothetical protein